MTWPSMSPDLKSAEHLWGILKRKVEQHKPLQQRAAGKKKWSKEEEDMCATLGSSMGRKNKPVIKIKGDI